MNLAKFWLKLFRRPPRHELLQPAVLFSRSAMSMPVEDFLKGANPDLVKILIAAGFKASIDIALIDEEMAGELTEPRPDLKSDLLAAAARARPSIGGWARAVSVLVGREGTAWRGVRSNLKQNLPPPRPSLPRGPGGPGTVKYAPPVPSVPQPGG